MLHRSSISLHGRVPLNLAECRTLLNIVFWAIMLCNNLIKLIMGPYCAYLKPHQFLSCISSFYCLRSMGSVVQTPHLQISVLFYSECVGALGHFRGLISLSCPHCKYPVMFWNQSRSGHIDLNLLCKHESDSCLKTCLFSHHWRVSSRGSCRHYWQSSGWLGCQVCFPLIWEWKGKTCYTKPKLSDRRTFQSLRNKQNHSGRANKSVPWQNTNLKKTTLISGRSAWKMFRATRGEQNYDAIEISTLVFSFKLKFRE